MLAWCISSHTRRTGTMWHVEYNTTRTAAAASTSPLPGPTASGVATIRKDVSAAGSQHLGPFSTDSKQRPILRIMRLLSWPPPWTPSCCLAVNQTTLNVWISAWRGLPQKVSCRQVARPAMSVVGPREQRRRSLRRPPRQWSTLAADGTWLCGVA